MVSNNYNKYGVNIKNEFMLLGKHADSKVDIKLLAIRAFTSTDYFLQLLYKLAGFKLTKIDDRKLKLSYKDQSIEFMKFSDFLTGNGSLKTKKELLNPKKRIGKCHDMSLCFVDFADKVVTGYVSLSNANWRTIHSWIETDKTVIDYTFNLVIAKEEYYKLVNAQVLSVINKNDVFSDFDSEFLKKLSGCKFYCLFREELFKNGLIEFGQENKVKKIK